MRSDPLIPYINDFSVHGAQQCAKAGVIEEWIHTYLNTGSWANVPLSDGLKLKERYWVGPVLVRLDNMDRACGPEEGMTYKEPEEQWDKRLLQIQTSLKEVTDLPPLITNSINGTLRNADGSFRFMIADGSHRLQALRNMGIEEFYVLIWFETEEQRAEYLEERKQLGNA